MTRKDRPVFSVDLSFEGDRDEDESESSFEEGRCLCKCMRITIALRLVAVTRLLLNLILLYIAFDTILVYLLAFTALGNFTVLCILISGVQEEKRNKIRYTKFWIVSDFVLEPISFE
ncbi:hypothetical protein AB6A40_011127 [Gnathostoma spinigerum]|uniref:Uncharacterized protein n=1 Tax=Gnathostoma spinigerum TaxID=75299 RepID=A0ABD6F300_9BILA